MARLLVERGAEGLVLVGHTHAPELLALLAAKGAGKDVKIIGTDGLPGPAGGIEAVAKGNWAATFTYPTGAKEAIEMSKKILLDHGGDLELAAASPRGTTFRLTLPAAPRETP